MGISSFAFFPKRAVGIDIGTSFLKVVELSRWGSSVRLLNYGELAAKSIYEKPFRTFEKNTLMLSNKDVGRALKGVLQGAGIKTTKAVFSIPDFSSFFTHFELPPMTQEEITGAVEFEAHRHIPIPLSEVAYDWEITSGKPGRQEPLRILLAAVPNELIYQYRDIATLAGLQLVALEAEIFGLIRSSKDMIEDEAVLLIDMGAQSTTVNLANKGSLTLSHSIDIGGNELTNRVSKALSISYEEAETKKQQEGVRLAVDRISILTPLIDVILLEVQKIMQNIQTDMRIEPKRILLAGGSANLVGLQEYVQEGLGLKTEIVDPFRAIFYPPILESVIRSMSPAYAVSLGMALRGLEK
ncbi:MAG: type IV pilus assembly protein PilM [bacterium]|nr:type IV pilus assembly protein PilM [bacterium]